MTRLALGSDHAGFDLRLELAEHLRAGGYEVIDLGTPDMTSVDYPDFGALVGREKELERLEDEVYEFRFAYYRERYDRAPCDYWDTWWSVLTGAGERFRGQPDAHAALVRRAVDAFLNRSVPGVADVIAQAQEFGGGQAVGGFDRGAIEKFAIAVELFVAVPDEKMLKPGTELIALRLVEIEGIFEIKQ